MKTFIHFRFAYLPVRFMLLAIIELLSIVPVLNAQNGAETPQAIFSSNLGSLVFISVQAHREHGLVDNFSGTGFIVHPDGYVLTCSHVIPETLDAYTKVDQAGSVGGRYKRSYPLTIVQRDPRLDLMLLRLSGSEQWQSVHSSCDAQRGANVVALGFPGDQDLVDLSGSIIGIDRDGRWLTDAGLTFGMSGGPVFNDSGIVVGIVAGGYEAAKRIDRFTPIRSATGLLQLINSPLLPITLCTPSHAPTSQMTLEEGLSALYIEASKGFLKYRGAFSTMEGDRAFYHGKIVFGEAEGAYCEKRKEDGVTSYHYTIYFPDTTIATYQELAEKLSKYLSDFKDFPDEDQIIWKRSKEHVRIILSKEPILGSRYKVFVEIRSYFGELW